MSNEYRSFMEELPAMTEGLIVTMPPTLEPHQQRLLASLGVLVRFDPTVSQDRFVQKVAHVQPKELKDGKPRWRKSDTGMYRWERILAAMTENRSYTTRELSQAINSSVSETSTILRRLTHDGFVVKLGVGRYRKSAS